MIPHAVRISVTTLKVDDVTKNNKAEIHWLLIDVALHNKKSLLELQSFATRGQSLFAPKLFYPHLLLLGEGQALYHHPKPKGIESIVLGQCRARLTTITAKGLDPCLLAKIKSFPRLLDETTVLPLDLIISSSETNWTSNMIMRQFEGNGNGASTGA